MSWNPGNKVKVSASTPIYGMAMLGAAFYFIQHAESFWGGVLGVIKAIFWPAVGMYKLLEYLKF